MRLPSRTIDLAAQLLEFDVWITPTLGEIKDTDRFSAELNRIATCLDQLSAATQGFESEDLCRAEVIAGPLSEALSTRHGPTLKQEFCDLASVLFMVTGKSDNNVKAQLPIFLRRRARSGVSLPWSEFSIPRQLKTEQLASVLVDARVAVAARRQLLTEFVAFVLSDNDYVAQLWSIGHSYVLLKPFGRERNLLNPLVTFQVRGSVSASGGHDPEALLRERLMQWGMVADRDFNTSDVVVDRLADAPEGVTEALLDEVVPEEEARPQERDKIRKYDFVLPYRTPGWESRLFIQSQFYAGDSGSVSHKNVDQTKASRPFVRRLYPDAVFMEYVDGAGYFSSLNGDLKTLLSMPTTSSFLQIRSAPIRLRRALQEIGFVVPLEVEQAVARGDGSRESVNRVLAGDGYRASEVDRAIADALSRGLVTATTGGLRLADARRDIVRRYALLDTVARHGEEIRHPANATNGLLVPGFGAFYGMKLTDLPNAAAQETPGFAEELGRTTVFVDDVAWLKEQELVLTS